MYHTSCDWNKDTAFCLNLWNQLGILFTPYSISPVTIFAPDSISPVTLFAPDSISPVTLLVSVIGFFLTTISSLTYGFLLTTASSFLKGIFITPAEKTFVGICLSPLGGLLSIVTSSCVSKICAFLTSVMASFVMFI